MLSPRAVTEPHALVSAFIQFVISLAIVSFAMLQPIQDGLRGLAVLFSLGLCLFFSIPIACIGMFILSSTTIAMHSVSPYCWLLALLVAQSMYPHGWHRYNWPDQYQDTMVHLSYAGYVFWLIALVAASAAVLMDLAFESPPMAWMTAMTYATLVSTGIALALYQTSVEGLRKYSQYAFKEGAFQKIAGASAS
jgi:hypothetical protein